MVLIPGQKINFIYKGSSPYASNILSGNAVATGNFQVLDGTAVGNYSNITTVSYTHLTLPTIYSV